MRSPAPRTPARLQRRSHRTIGLIAGLILVVAACGSDDASDAPVDTTGATDAPVETTPDTDPPADTTAGTEVSSQTTPDTEPPAAPTVGTDAPAPTTAGTEMPADGEIPERIVSLSPTHTEIVFAIGADDLLVAVDDFSNFPQEALELPNELSGFQPDVEAIASYEPDVVLLSGDGDGLSAQLGELGIDTWIGTSAETFDDTYTQIEQLGALTGNVGEAAELVGQMQSDIDAAVAAIPEGTPELSYYHELTTELYTATSDTFIGEVYSLFGLANVADGVDDAAGGYPQLSAEFLIDADPDLVFLADTKCCEASAESFSQRPGYESIGAVEAGVVTELDDDVASRWGPRLVDFIEAVSGAVANAPVPA